MKLNELEAVLEAILFLSGDAVSLSVLADAIHMDRATTKAMLHQMQQQYEQEGRGLRLVEVEGAYQLCTAAKCYEYLKTIYHTVRGQALTESLLETLAIIAYRQPITRAQVEEIRGVSAEHAIRKLQDRGLIEEVGKLDAVGRPILYGTTQDFLRYFGLSSKEALPPLEEEPFGDTSPE
ncbi:MAG TPA: SMC-Scp complex subunit ScpB [Firmicutes bacterium]|nr:SMC-Scp complex subunit ScpB [Bacillota bacterium]